MNEQFIRNELIPALRSGQYKQGRMRLKRTSVIAPEEQTFCCLGVVCDLFNKNGVGYWDNGWFVGTGNSEDLELPVVIADELGITTNGYFTETLQVYEEVREKLTREAREIISAGAECLVDLNDRGATFDDIATIIEAVLDGKATPFLTREEEESRKHGVVAAG